MRTGVPKRIFAHQYLKHHDSYRTHIHKDKFGTGPRSKIAGKLQTSMVEQRLSKLITVRTFGMEKSVVVQRWLEVRVTDWMYMCCSCLRINQNSCISHQTRTKNIINFLLPIPCLKHMFYQTIYPCVKIKSLLQL